MLYYTLLKDALNLLSNIHNKLSESEVKEYERIRDSMTSYIPDLEEYDYD